jgi:hypothetical protein
METINDIAMVLGYVFAGIIVTVIVVYVKSKIMPFPRNGFYYKTKGE